MRISIFRLILLLGMFTTFLTSFGKTNSIHSPVDIPIYLAGNYGELRSTHFHAGIDIKTNSETGHRIYSVQSGYISRIKVQAGGYGHAIYITHPSGLTSVYGHLQEYYPELENYLKEKQYEKQSYTVDLYLKKDQFPVSEGQFIALSGNSGSSMGPHLHFELRNSSQVPQNVLKFGLPIKDTIAPKFKTLAVYNNIDPQTFSTSDKELYPVSGSKEKYYINKPIKVGNSVAFGAEVYDYLNGSTNRCGVYTLDFKLDQNVLFSFTVDNISFVQTGCIKSHMDYAERKIHKRNVHKLFHEPNNLLSIYNTIINQGLVFLEDSLLHQCEIKASDVNGNVSTLVFSIYKVSTDETVTMDSGLVLMPYDKPTVFSEEDIELDVPKNSLYSSKWFSYNSVPSENYLSKVYEIGDETVPLKNYPTLKIKVADDVKKVNHDKLLIAKLEKTNKLSSEGGQWENGFVKTRISSFGQFVVVADTIPPKIIPLSFKDESWYAANDIISFKISDDLSGIKTYNGYIDGNWVLFEYDAKSDLLFYSVDNERLKSSNDKHTIELFVMDDRNNIRNYKGYFYY